MTLEKLFGLKPKTADLLKLVYQFMGVFRYVCISTEMANCLKKNLVYLITVFIAELKAKNVTEPEVETAKIFKKASYIGRKVLGNCNNKFAEGARVSLQAILELYKENVTIFKDDMPYLKSTCGPILELVYRTYTDDSLKISEIKDISSELIDTLSTSFDDKAFFI
jgi:hypothetical protein